MTGKHTPAPWVMVEADDGVEIGEGQWIGPDDGFTGYFIATVWGGHDGEMTNARLIAAAPDLLKALVDLLQVNDGIPMLGVEASRRIDAARAAIAKAKGGAA